MSLTLAPASVEYPDNDGNPMSDNTRQFHAIVMLQGNLDALFATDPDVFVAGDLLWYAVEGSNRIRQAPDTMVAFGRPKGHRGSYKQWEEGGIPPQVVFEVLSPGNRAGEMARKFDFYERYGVEEYYVYDPDRLDFVGWLRDDTGNLRPIDEINGWVSPRLRVRFVMEADQDLQVFYPNGDPFLTFAELAERREADRQGQLIAERERDQAERARDAAEQERDIAEQERDAAARARDEAVEQAARLAARLRELGMDPDAA
jgi:Uma2 family endonuclease